MTVTVTLTLTFCCDDGVGDGGHSELQTCVVENIVCVSDGDEKSGKNEPGKQNRVSDCVCALIVQTTTAKY